MCKTQKHALSNFLPPKMDDFITDSHIDYKSYYVPLGSLILNRSLSYIPFPTTSKTTVGFLWVCHESSRYRWNNSFFFFIRSRSESACTSTTRYHFIHDTMLPCQGLRNFWDTTIIPWGNWTSSSNTYFHVSSKNRFEVTRFLKHGWSPMI